MEVQPTQALLVYNLSVGPLQLVVQIFTLVPVFHFLISPIVGDMRDCVPAPPKAQQHLLCLHGIQQQAVLINIAWKQWKPSTKQSACLESWMSVVKKKVFWWTRCCRSDI